MMLEINHLPAEMLLEVHRRMTPSSLKKAVLVSKLWRDVGQDPALWDWCKVAVYTKEDISNLSIKRLQRIKEILINPRNWDVDDWEALFQAVNEFSSLKKIDGLDRCGWGCLNLVKPDLFARALAKLKDVVVTSCTYDQILALFTEMSNTTQMKTFGLLSGDLSQMDPGLFARVLSRLENLKLDISHVTTDQMQAFFTEILNIRSLKRLDLSYEFCEGMWLHLEPRFFAKVLSTVEDVTLRYYDDDGIAIDHMEALFTEMSLGTQLKRLVLDETDLSEIEPALLANTLSRLEELRLKRTFITTDQIQALFTEISLRTQMKKIALVSTDLSQLGSGLFARVMVRLEDVELTGFDVTTDQMVELFTDMSGNSHLKSLCITNVDLSPVDPEVLSKAVTGLETLILRVTRITNDQVVSLFSEMSRNTVMKKINFNGYELTLSSVEPELLASALIRLEEVRADSITHDQAKALIREMSQNSQNCHLKNLKLYNVDFSTVDPEGLATAVTNVKEVSLRFSNFSEEQITRIFTHVLEGEKKLRKLDIRGIGCAVTNVNPEILSQVKEKLKGEFFFSYERTKLDLPLGC